jgi:hypothetical protein
MSEWGRHYHFLRTEFDMRREACSRSVDYAGQGVCMRLSLLSSRGDRCRSERLSRMHARTAFASAGMCDRARLGHKGRSPVHLPPSRPELLAPASQSSRAQNLLTGGMIVIAALYMGRGVLIPITLAVLLSFIVAPLLGLRRPFKSSSCRR